MRCLLAAALAISLAGQVGPALAYADSDEAGHALNEPAPSAQEERG